MIDAIYIKVCKGYKVRSKALLITLGINETGHREIIGFTLADSECETNWINFFYHLQERGLTSLKLIGSDAHQGLKRVIQKCFQES